MTPTPAHRIAAAIAQVRGRATEVSDKPVLLDCFCKAGGCSRGYQDAGLYVVGLDIEDQPRYIGDAFIRMDALEALRILIDGGYITDTTGRKWYLSDFSVIHCSPPCQFYSDLKTLSGKIYQDLVGDTRNLLRQTGKPYIIENVEGAPLEMPVMLCGVMFGLKVFRHRLFETNPWMLAPGHLKHDGSTGTHRWPYTPTNGYVQVTGNGGNFTLEQAQKAMRISWMNKEEISQAIPPAFTRWIGEQLMRAIGGGL